MTTKTSKMKPFPTSLSDLFQRRRKSDVTGHAFTIDDVNGMKRVAKPELCMEECSKYHRRNSITILPIPQIIIDHHDNEDEDDVDDDEDSDSDVTAHKPVTFDLHHGIYEHVDFSNRKAKLILKRSNSLGCLDVGHPEKNPVRVPSKIENTVTKKPLQRSTHVDPTTSILVACSAAELSTSEILQKLKYSTSDTKCSSFGGKTDATGNPSPMASPKLRPRSQGNPPANKSSLASPPTLRRSRNALLDIDTSLGTPPPYRRQASSMTPPRERKRGPASTGSMSALTTPPTMRKSSTYLSSSFGNSSLASKPPMIPKTSAVHSPTSAVHSPTWSDPTSSPVSSPTKSTPSSSSPTRVPQITLKKRECGYEGDVALIQQQRKERSNSVCSSLSPLLPLSAIDLLQADDDERASIASSMTSLSIFSYSSAGSCYSSDSGVGMGKTRRSVSFGAADADRMESYRNRTAQRDKGYQGCWHDSQYDNGDSISIASCNVYGVGDGKGRYRHRSSPEENPLHHSHDATLLRNCNGSFNYIGLHPHSACCGSYQSSRYKSVSCHSLDSLNSEPDSGDTYFTAKFYNRIGKKMDGSDALSNLSHVYHVYKGMVLLTDLLESKITFMASNGRAVKEFLADPGSQPWCTCVTLKGHVAVTLRRQSCVTVWSGHGSLVREFGHDVLKCPTGLACDKKGRFIVTDEQTNKVAMFSEHGTFIKFLGYKEDNSAESEDESEPAQKAGMPSGRKTSSVSDSTDRNNNDADTEAGMPSGRKTNSVSNFTDRNNNDADTDDQKDNESRNSSQQPKERKSNESPNSGVEVHDGSEDEDVHDDFKSLAKNDSNDCGCKSRASFTSVTLQKCNENQSSHEKSAKGDHRRKDSSVSDAENKTKLGQGRNGSANKDGSNGRSSYSGSRKNSNDDSTKDEEKAFKFNLPRYIWVSNNGNIVVSDSGSNSVKVFNTDGVFIRSIGTNGTGDGQLKVPYGVCCDQQDNVYVADHYNDRISVFTMDGEFIQHVVTSAAGIFRPKSIAMRCNADERKLYIAHGGLRSSEVAVYKLYSGRSRRHSVTFKCDI